ncbi:MAG: N-6 DNA methylase [Candidatus Onthovivens sp.]|nr:N-6 DNA methylase [Bacilli bacterium]
MAKTNETLFKLESIIRSETLGERSSYMVISNAYQYVCNNNLIYYKNCELLEIAHEMNEHISSEVIDKLNDLYDKLGIEGIRTLLYDLLSGKNNGPRTFIESSNNYISELANDLLEVDGSDNIVIDFGSGTGNFLANVYRKAHDNKFVLKDLIGVEINVEQAHISQMALSILSDGSVNPQIVIGNALEKINHPYTKAYVFPPLGMRKPLNDDFRRSFLFQDVYLSNRNSAEWLFIDNMLSGLLGDKAVALVTGKALFSNTDIEYRNKLVSSGWLEGIIELPSGSLSFTGMKVYMLIFSKNNKEVKFVDASNVIGVENKRYVNLELPVKTIEEMYFSKDVKTKPIEELIDIPNLCPSTIMLDVKKMENGVKLKELADVFIGNQYTLGVFESKGLISDKKTGYRILTSSDIENGMVRWEALRSVVMKDNKFDKFAIQFGDVVVTSKSSKVKTVVVDIEPKEKILVTGGMLIVRPQLGKLNPTYLKMFLDSEMGQSALKSIQKGTIIVTVSASGLSSIEIPMIDINKQQEKAERYNEKLSTLATYKKEIERIENSLKNLFEEEED